MHLQEHQQRVVDRPGNTLAYHSLGSGKTLTGLAAIARALKEDTGDAVFIVPAPLVNNVQKEIDKHGVDIDKDRLKVMSYEKASRRSTELWDPKAITVFDEAHRARNVGTARRKVVDQLVATSKKNLMLTGTPIYNHMDDISSLVNMTAGEKVLDPISETFIGIRKTPVSLLDRLRKITPGDEQYLKNKKGLSKVLNAYVDKHIVTQGDEDFPEKREKIIKVEMSKAQQIAYKAVEGSIPEDLKVKIDGGHPLTVGEARKLTLFATGLRMASISTGGILHGDRVISSKLDAAVDSLATKHASTPNHKAVVYSNYLKAGVLPYVDRLEKRGLGDQVQMFTGGLTDKKRKAIIEKYNSGEKPILVVSSAGSEGLDLKGTKLMQILDPHFNNEKINQVIGRGARYHSHAHLPPEERVLNIERYHSIFPKGFFGGRKKGIDETLHGMAQKKDEINHKILELIGDNDVPK